MNYRLNYRLLTAALMASLLLAGCGLFSKAPQKDDMQTSIVKKPNGAGNGSGDVQTIQFATGVSSVSVEKLALQNQCVSTKGAALITPKGAIEVYRVNCDDGRNFMAKCELRQCRPMAAK